MNGRDAYEHLRVVLEWLDERGLALIAIDVNQAMEKLVDAHIVEEPEGAPEPASVPR